MFNIFFKLYPTFIIINIYSYEPKLRNILEAINNLKHDEKLLNNYDITLQNVGLVLKFIHHLIQIKNEDLFIMYSTIITHILQWIQYLDLQEQVMSILQTIIINVRTNNVHLDQSLQCDIYRNLEESLNVSTKCEFKITCQLLELL